MNKHRTGIMKPKLILILALWGILAWAGTVAAKDLGSDRVAAVVNNQVIPLSEIIKNKQPFMRSMSLQLGVIPPGKWPTERELLDELIVIHLLEQEAVRKDIKIDDRMVEASIEAIRKRNNLTPDKFIGQLARSGINYDDYRKMMKRQLLLSRLIDREVTSKVPMSEEDAQRYFKANRDSIDDHFKKLVESMSPPKPPEEEVKPEIPTHEELHIGGKLRLRQIVLNIPANAKPQAIKNVMEKAKRIHSEAMTGADFGQLAQKYSDDPSAKKGGDLGWIDYKDLSPNIQKMVQHLKPGDIYPVQARTAVVVFYLEDAKGRSTKRIPIPEKQRKELERRWKEQYEKRDTAAKQQQAAEPDGEEVRREEPKKTAKEDKTANNPKKSSTILTPEEEKEYEKVRNKVIAILKTEKIQARMKDWIDELKKNSVIEVKL
jgi:peptidyl-prolyl cis-trans isomerase SurA